MIAQSRRRRARKLSAFPSKTVRMKDAVGEFGRSEQPRGNDHVCADAVIVKCQPSFLSIDHHQPLDLGLVLRGNLLNYPH